MLAERRLTVRVSAVVSAILILAVVIVALPQPEPLRAAALLTSSDTLSRLKVNTAADHTVSWTLPAGVSFDAGDKARLDFPVHFSTSAGWLASDFAFNDGSIRTVADVAVDATPSCPAGANNVSVEVRTTNDQFILTACPSFTSSATGATAIFTLAGTSPDGTIQNPSTSGSYLLSIVGDDKGNGFGGDDDVTGIGIGIASDDLVGVNVSVSALVPPPNGGGGGGFVGVIPVPPALPTPFTSVTFSGWGYPGRAVRVLKDAVFVQTVAAASDGSFSVELAGLTPGTYTFSFWSDDEKGTRSALLTFPVTLAANAATSVSGLVLAPTLTVDKQEVKQGEPVVVSGQSLPNATITLVFAATEQEQIVTTTADTVGRYQVTVDSKTLTLGQYSVRAKSSWQAISSGFGRVVTFLVGDKTVVDVPASGSIGDLNDDGRVSLVDFAIMAYWYKRASPPAHVDLNHDGAVTLVDLAILAYYWTG